MSNAQAAPKSFPLRLLAVSVATLVVGSLLFVFQKEDAAPPGVPPLPEPLVHVAPCSADAAHAALRGRELERFAEGAFERAPFDDADMPQAVKAMAEAELCYALAHEREARLRAEARRTTFARDLAMRVQRAQLAMVIAQRAGDAALLARHTAVLLALLGAAGEAGAAHREALTRLLRTARAADTAQRQTPGG